MIPEGFLRDLQQGLQEMLSEDAWEAAVQAENAWFTPGLVREALRAILSWWEPGSTMPDPQSCLCPGRVGLILAGNIPLVGFHDFLAVLLAGHVPVVKLSRKDQALWLELLRRMPPQFRNLFELTAELDPRKIDFLIATGSDNTARYLDHQFAGVPRILRRNRFSAAVLDGNESPQELSQLASDILMYHGMGCRSISNVLLPDTAALEPIFQALNAFPKEWMAPEWTRVIGWEQAVKAMAGTGSMASDAVAIQAVEALSIAPFGTLNVIRYGSQEELVDLLEQARNSLQCVVGIGQKNSLGNAQCPRWDDFADGIDVIQVLGEQLGQAKA